MGEGLFGRFGLAFQGLSCPLGRRGILIAISSGVRRGGWVGKDLFTVASWELTKTKTIYIYICIHDALIAGKMCLLFLRLMSGAVCTAVAKGVQHTGRAYLHVCEHICMYASIYAYTHICLLLLSEGLIETQKYN